VDVSVIIITRNTCALTRAAVQSVLDGHNVLEVEIIVTDNGSTDETPAILPREFFGIKFIRSETNLGFAQAVNLAAKSAAGEFLLLLNSDARHAPDALVQAVEWMRANPNCAVVGGQLLNSDGTRQNSIANFPTLATELFNKSLLRRIRPKKFPGKEQIFTKPIEVESVVGAFMLIRKSVWDMLGGLDERFFFFFEETDFCRQVRQKKLNVMHLPQVHVWHGQGQTAKQVSAAARIEYWRSRYCYFAKNFGATTQFALIVGLLLRLLIDWLAAGLLTGLTLGQNSRWRLRLQICSRLVVWHLRGCPQRFGLPR